MHRACTGPSECGWKHGGNLVEQPLGDLVASPHFRQLFAAIETGVDACRAECEYFTLCGGGCPSNKLAELDSLAATETAHYRLTKRVLADVVLARFEAALAN